jgi:hypothetical protein
VKIPRYPVTVTGKIPSHTVTGQLGRPAEKLPSSQETLVYALPLEAITLFGLSIFFFALLKSLKKAIGTNLKRFSHFQRIAAWDYSNHKLGVIGVFFSERSFYVLFLFTSPQDF